MIFYFQNGIIVAHSEDVSTCAVYSFLIHDSLGGMFLAIRISEQNIDYYEVAICLGGMQFDFITLFLM